jgi:hypothetical protein
LSILEPDSKKLRQITMDHDAYAAGMDWKMEQLTSAVQAASSWVSDDNDTWSESALSRVGPTQSSLNVVWMKAMSFELLRLL